MIKGKHALASVAVLLSVGLAAQSQSADPAAGDPERRLPEVDVLGVSPAYHAALIALMNGEYVEAEKKFRAIESRLRIIAQQDFQGLNFSGIDPQLAATRITVKGAGRFGGQVDRPLFEFKDLGPAFYGIGLAKVGQGDIEGAEDFFRRAIGADKSLQDARARVGLIELSRGELKRAKRRLDYMEGWRANCIDLCEDEADLRVATERLRIAVRRAEAAASAEP